MLWLLAVDDADAIVAVGGVEPAHVLLLSLLLKFVC